MTQLRALFLMRMRFFSSPFRFPPRAPALSPQITAGLDAAAKAASASSVEVVRTSGTSGGAGRLTRQLIPLLVAGGVPESVLLARQLAAADPVLAILKTPMLKHDPEKAVDIIQVLQAQPPALRDPGDPNSCTTGELPSMLIAGFTQAEPYVADQCRSLVRARLVALRSGRVPVPQSGYAMGSADPTGALPEGHVVLLQNGSPLIGEVLVYKSPGLHCGDVRRLRAVANEAVLAEILSPGVDRARATLLVFSVRGARAEADKIANSDLDGDEYLVRSACVRRTAAHACCL